jgi:hypothetical protein
VLVPQTRVYGCGIRPVRCSRAVIGIRGMRGAFGLNVPLESTRDIAERPGRKCACAIFQRESWLMLVDHGGKRWDPEAQGLPRMTVASQLRLARTKTAP